MKLLQNRSTGEIGCLVCSFGKTPEKITVVQYIDGKRGSKVWYYGSLAELNEQDRLKHIAKIAADAAGRVATITRKLADHDILMNDLSELTYQLGYIEGLSYVPEGGDEN